MREARLARVISRIRGWLISRRIRRAGGTCGSGLVVGASVRFKYPIDANVTLGRNVSIGSNVEFHLAEGSRLIIGNDVKLTGYAFISATTSITIGRDCMIAEFVSIRDADHGIASGDSMQRQRMRIAPIVVGEGVWIARGVAVLRGSVLGDGCVLAANAVVKGNVSAGTIVGGVPAKVIGMR